MYKRKRRRKFNRGRGSKYKNKGTRRNVNRWRRMERCSKDKTVGNRDRSFVK